jgi:hypothetical protein
MEIERFLKVESAIHAHLILLGLFVLNRNHKVIGSARYHASVEDLARCLDTVVVLIPIFIPDLDPSVQAHRNE